MDERYDLLGEIRVLYEAYPTPRTDAERLKWQEMDALARDACQNISAVTLRLIVARMREIVADLETGKA